MNEPRLYWCGEGCGFVGKNHRCEQWCNVYIIPGKAVDALQSDLLRERDELRAKLERIEKVIEEAGNQIYIASDGIGSVDQCRNLIQQALEMCCE